MKNRILRIFSINRNLKEVRYDEKMYLREGRYIEDNFKYLLRCQVEDKEVRYKNKRCMYMKKMF